MLKTKSLSLALLLPTAIAFLALAGCGQKTPTSNDPAVQAQIDKDAELKAKEEELAQREAALAQADQDAKSASEEQARKDAEAALKKREQELAKREAAVAKANAPKPAAPSGPRKYTVAAGTSISVQLPATITTKNAKVGDRIAANLSNDLVVDGKVIAKAGALLQGSISEVVSGSNKIGGTAKLGLTFDNMVLADGSDTRVSGSVTQVAAKSDTGKDTAKIVGGAAIGAIIANNVSGSSNASVIGGLIGAAAGTAAAKKTGSEVELPAGTVLGFTLNSPVDVEM